ncbi:hypothetical protein [Streptomyces sp. NPDC055506]
MSSPAQHVLGRLTPYEATPRVWSLGRCREDKSLVITENPTHLLVTVPDPRLST